jgi:hypothetical protein
MAPPPVAQAPRSYGNGNGSYGNGSGNGSYGNGSYGNGNSNGNGDSGNGNNYAYGNGASDPQPDVHELLRFRQGVLPAGHELSRGLAPGDADAEESLDVLEAAGAPERGNARQIRRP